MIQFEEALKQNPGLADIPPGELEREFYLRSGGVGAPGVGPFTSAVAEQAVATLMNLIKRFRRIPSDLRDDNIWVDFIHMNIHSNEPQSNPACLHCQTGFLLLKKEEQYRLDTPKLGKLPPND